MAGVTELAMSTTEDPSAVLNDSLCDVCGHLVTCTGDKNLYEFLFAGVLLNIINSFGIVCNIISIYILSQKQMRVSINCCLVGLASFDILLLVCSIFVWGIPAIGRYTGRLQTLSGVIIPSMTPWLYPLASIAHTGSTYVTVTVTVERYVAVCHSLKARYICTYGRARLYMILITVFVVLYNVPKFLEIEAKPIIELETNMTRGYVTCPTELRNQQSYIEIYIMWMYLIVMYCIPFGALLLLNGFIYCSIRKANKMRQLLSRRQQKEIGLATMLFAIVLLFMACNSLSFVINIIEVLGSKSNSIVPEIVFDRMADFSNLMVNVNSSSNFIIYCIFGQKFRRLFLRLFCARCSCLSRFQAWGGHDDQPSCIDPAASGMRMKRLNTGPDVVNIAAEGRRLLASGQMRPARRDTTLSRISTVRTASRSPSRLEETTQGGL